MKSTHFSTLAVHAAEAPDPTTGAVAPILVRSKTFAQKFGKEAFYQYSRGKNPTRYQLEQKLAILDNGKYATTFASGIAATNAFFLSLNPGDHVLCCQEIYGGTFRLLDQLVSKFGISSDYVDFSTAQSIKQHIKTNTKWLFVETPTNPSLHIIDLRLVAQVSRETGIPFTVDATFAPPCATKPLDYGAAIVLHSLSKYIAGHNDILGGALITNDPDLHKKFIFQQKAGGAILSPDESWRVLQGVKTLHLRWKHVSQTALEVASFLTTSLSPQQVFYPGLPTHPGHLIAKRQTQLGFGGVISFVLPEPLIQKLPAFVEAVTSSQLVVYGESLASPETILAYPAMMSHLSLARDTRYSLGITDGFFRLSVGFEEPSDIISALHDGFEALK